MGLKTHCKAALVVRREHDGIRRYIHLGTGNYNEKTARLYTDFGLMTADRVIGEDASAFFNALTGYSDPPRMKKLAMAPSQLRDRVLRLIERETRRAQDGQPALIRFYTRHVIALPLLAAIMMAVHFWRIRRDGGMARPL